MDSVLKQLPENAELIVVDDGSRDNTAQVLKAYENRECVNILYNAHKGPSGARNAGLDRARGEFVAFLDCDDRLKEGFLEKGLKLTESGADLYIFGIERITLDAGSELWTVNDREYPDISDFADDYIRDHRLLIYSNCNKFYRREIIEKAGLRFEEGIAFGEDRLLNYGFLKSCGSVFTSSYIMLEYVQRSLQSLSGRHVPDYLDIVMGLHRAKMDCFLGLSKGTSEEERLDFMAYDFSREIENTVSRFADHPEEVEENLPKINRIIFDGPYEEEPVDFLIVAGSTNCGYRIRTALEFGRKYPGVRYIVSGGNPHISGTGTEAEFMADYLKSHGVPAEDICLENSAKDTRQNLAFSAEIIKRIRRKDGGAAGPKAIGVVTGAFHIRRTSIIAKGIGGLEKEKLVFIPAYGPSTGAENWYKNDYGRSVILAELQKLIRMGYSPFGEK